VSESIDWVEQARRLVAGLGQAGSGPAWAAAPGEGHVPGGDCRWCPVCQLAAVARRPEVSEALADALTSAATALRAIAAAAAEAPAPAAGDGPAGRQEEPAAPPPPPVQHIEIG
jgi:hypothetical protein